MRQPIAQEHYLYTWRLDVFRNGLIMTYKVDGFVAIIHTRLAVGQPGKKYRSSKNNSLHRQKKDKRMGLRHWMQMVPLLQVRYLRIWKIHLYMQTEANSLQQEDLGESIWMSKLAISMYGRINTANISLFKLNARKIKSIKISEQKSGFILKK